MGGKNLSIHMHQKFHPPDRDEAGAWLNYAMIAAEHNTEDIRRNRLAIVNGAVESFDPAAERKRLETEHGQVWDTAQLASDFEVLGFMAPYAVVHRRSDGLKGSLEFQHQPRFYFNFVADRA